MNGHLKDCFNSLFFHFYDQDNNNKYENTIDDLS